MLAIPVNATAKMRNRFLANVFRQSMDCWYFIFGISAFRNLEMHAFSM
jgi:hypothetical protein